MLRRSVPLITAAIIVAADRITKILLMQSLNPGEWRPIFPGLTLTHVHNTGIAFSLFADAGWLSRIALHGVILAAVVLIAWMLFRHAHQSLSSGLAFGLILGGAIGNLTDRVLHGWVVDFIHVWVRIGGRTWSWPDFNVADSAITVGAILLILGEIRGGQKERGDAPGSD
jgi:signal peptidase II